MLRSSTLILATSGVAAMACVAAAVPIVPGDFISPLPGTTSAAEPQLAGVTVQDVQRTIAGNFVGSNLPYEIKVQDRVVLATDGTYDFYYSVTFVDKPDAYPLGISRDGFAGYSSNVGWRSDGTGTVAPQSATRTLDGDKVQFNFSGPSVPEGTVTRFFFVDTQATSYAFNGEAIVDLSPSFNENARVAFSTFAPAVPEPALLGSLTFALFLLPRRSKRV